MAITDTNHRGEQYPEFLKSLQQTYEENATGAKLFRVHVKDLFSRFLSNLPTNNQHYNCNACRSFIKKYGSLVTILPSGQIRSALFEPGNTPEFFQIAITDLKEYVERSKVYSVFITDVPTWGLPCNGEWNHMHLYPLKEHVTFSPIKTSYQLTAEKVENFRNTLRAMKKYNTQTLNTAQAFFKSDKIHSAEKFAPVLSWLAGLRGMFGPGSNHLQVSNIVWSQVANAPDGFCHIGGSVVGSVLDDIADGLGFASVKARYLKKMHGLAYQRPSEAPKQGNIEQAEKLFATLGLGQSVERRYATLDEVPKIWEPAREAYSKNSDEAGLFTHIKPRSAEVERELDVPAIRITWDKFKRTVLDGCESMEFMVPFRSVSNYCAFTTAKHAEAPMLFKWDNPFCRYVYSGGSSPEQWGLVIGQFVKVTAVCGAPHSLGRVEALSHLGDMALIVLQGAKDSKYLTSGGAIFPANLRSELHGVRAVVEAYSKTAVISGQENSSVCGIAVEKGPGDHGYLLRVVVQGVTSLYKIDRWD